MFYVYVNNDKYIKVNSTNLKISLTSNIEKCGYWTDEKKANSWKFVINAKYPNAELKKAYLKIIT